jgi:flagellar FliL protein
MSKQHDEFDNDLELKLSTSTTETTSDLINDYRAVKGKRIYIIVGSILAFALVGYLLTMIVSQNLKKHNSVELSEIDVRYEHNGVLFDFPEIVTNLAPTNDKDSSIKLSVTLEVSASKNLDVIDQKLSMIKDSMIIFLREVRASDLTSSGGGLMLKTELMKRINKILYPIELKDILFKEIFIN